MLLHSRRLELGSEAQVENGRKGIVGMQVCVWGGQGWGVTEHSMNTIGEKAEHTRHAKSQFSSGQCESIEQILIEHVLRGRHCDSTRDTMLNKTDTGPGSLATGRYRQVDRQLQCSVTGAVIGKSAGAMRTQTEAALTWSSENLQKKGS